MIFPDFMRDDDPFITVRMAVDIFQENFFIGWPGAAADYGGAAVTELLYFGDLFCIFRDLFYPVETGISCQSDILYADGFQ